MLLVIGSRALLPSGSTCPNDVYPSPSPSLELGFLDGGKQNRGVENIRVLKQVLFLQIN